MITNAGTNAQVFNGPRKEEVRKLWPRLLQIYLVNYITSLTNSNKNKVSILLFIMIFLILLMNNKVSVQGSIYSVFWKDLSAYLRMDQYLALPCLALPCPAGWPGASTESDAA